VRRNYLFELNKWSEEEWLVHIWTRRARKSIFFLFLMNLFVTWVIFHNLGNGVGFRLALCQPPISGLEVSSDTFASLEPIIYFPETCDYRVITYSRFVSRGAAPGRYLGIDINNPPYLPRSE
jgi:hypothetical protein